MNLRVEVLVCLLFASCITSMPVSEDGPEFTLEDEDHIKPSLESRFSFDGEEEVEDVKLENGKFYQGDIVLLDDQLEYLLGNGTDDSSTPTRTGWINEYYRWPKDASGFVIFSYEVSPTATFTSYHKSYIQLAMDTIEKYTCVRFRKRTTEKDYVSIVDGKGCHSNMGKIGGKQEISLQKNGCFSKGTIMHEMIHALGYDHMHSSSDRDKYVEIAYNNIRPEAVSNFDRVNPKKFSNFGTEYDLFSVMHYDKKAFSKNGLDTIVPRNRRFAKVIGQRVGLSKDDVKRINNMYECVV